jgi:amphi-Trp domain-containing protein
MSTQKKKKRDVEREVTKEQFLSRVRRLAEALDADEPFVIQVAGEKIRVPREAVLSIEHEREGDDEEIEFQFKWQRKRAR